MSFLAELKRRNVFRVAIAYIALWWVLLQVTDIVVPALNLPETINSIVVYLGIIGFFFAVFFAWAFELTPEGIKPSDEVDEAVSIRATTGQRINRLIIGLMSIALALLLFDRFSAPEQATLAEGPARETIENSIAVMPFVDMSADGSQEYFGDGMAEEILNVLVTIEELDVTSRTTAFSLKGANLSIPEIAERLDVNYILEGSIRSDGNSVRVTAQLIDVANDTHLWSRTFDRELQGIFAIQDEISLAIADALKVELLGDQVGDVPTENMAAYDLYLQALRKFDVPSWEQIREAQDLLSRVVELDPDFADAWGGLSASYNAEVVYGELSNADIDRNIDLSIDAANRALLLNPELVVALLTIANANVHRLDWAQAWLYFDRASQLMNNNQYTSDAGLFYTAVGWFDDAIVALERAVEMSPENAVIHSVLGRAYISHGELAKGIAELEKTMAMGYPAGYDNMAIVDLMTGDASGAKSRLWQFVPEELSAESGALRPGVSLDDYREKMIDGYFDPSLRAEFAELLPENEQAYRLITGSMLLKNGEHLVRWLDDSTFNRFLTITYIFAPPFRDMLNQPAMKDYINLVGLPDFWRKNKWPHFCRPVGEDDYECQDMQGHYP